MKDYSSWHKIKTESENTGQSKLFREREIWWTSIGNNIGFEQDGKHDLYERPVLVFRKFNKEMFWALPMTSKAKEGKFYFSFPLHGENRTAILSQLRVLSSKRLIRRIGKISNQNFIDVETAIINLIKSNDPLSGASGA